MAFPGHGSSDHFFYTGKLGVFALFPRSMCESGGMDAL